MIGTLILRVPLLSLLQINKRDVTVVDKNKSTNLSTYIDHYVKDFMLDRYHSFFC